MGQLIWSRERIVSNSSKKSYFYAYACKHCESEVVYSTNRGKVYDQAICSKCRRHKDRLRAKNYKIRRDNKLRNAVVDELCQDYNLEIMLTKSSKRDLEAFIRSLIPMEEYLDENINK